jgi:hypothetical protein
MDRQLREKSSERKQNIQILGMAMGYDQNGNFNAGGAQ